MEYWNLIGWEPFTWELDFSQACNFLRMLMNHKNFDFKKIPDKNNAVIFLKSPKTMFLGQFWPFLPYGFFFQKIQLCLTKLYMNFWHAKFQKKIITQSQENLWADKSNFIESFPPRPRAQQPLFSKWLLGIHQILF